MAHVNSTIKAVHLARIMCHNNQSSAPVDKADKHVKHIIPCRLIEAASRLVSKNHSRLRDQSPCDCNTLPFSAGQTCNWTVCKMSKTNSIKPVLRTRPTFAPPNTRIAQRQRHIVDCRKIFDQAGILKNEANLPPSQQKFVSHRKLGKRGSREKHLTGGGPAKPPHHFKNRRFARPRCAEYCNFFTLRDA